MKKSKLLCVLFLFLLCGIHETRAGDFTASGSTLTLDLNVANQLVSVVSNGTSYTFTLSGGATNTWSGTTSSSVSVSGAVLTVTSTGLSTFNTINITDSQTGNAVTFNTSGANAYTDNFNITLDNTPGAVTFNGSSNFTGSSAINVTTSRYVYFTASSSLKTENGNLTLDANTQESPNNFSYSGITVDASTVEITGTGILTMSARGGTGSSSSYANNGIAVVKGGIVKGGTTGTTSITGRGYTGLAGTVFNLYACGVMVAGVNTATPSTITSNGSNVVVTGYGANSTAAPPSATTVIGHVGVSVGTPQYNTGTFSTSIVSGLITSGGSGTVTINGYGGTSANLSATGYFHSCMGVGVFGSSNTITSGGAGKVTITGTGAGPNDLSDGNSGVYVTGNITSGTNADLEVIGYQGTSKNNSSMYFNSGNAGVALYTSSAFIRAGAGTGNTRVVGTGVTSTTSNSARAYGVWLSAGGTISSLGSGNVTVIGYGGGTEIGSNGNNNGVYLSGNGASTPTISSNGGNVRVEGTGGGINTTNNLGVAVTINSSISAGGSGSVTVIGNGGNNNGTSGNSNYGVYLTSFGSGQAQGYITSSSGDITVTGTGGGGNTSSAAASSSSNNHGVFVDQGGYIVAGGSGNVTINGNGGNTSPGATGGTNYGVYVKAFSSKQTNVSVYNNRITTSGGNLIVNGTGGGNASSGTNHGIFNEGLLSATGSGTVTINGQGGNNTSLATNGGSNYGVNITGAPLVNSVTYPATITSDGGNVTVTGTGGGNNGTGSTNYGVNVSSGGLITAGTNGVVSVTGTGGNTTGIQNYGVQVTGITNTIPSTITSGGGNVMVIGNAPQSTGGTGQFGVYVTSNGVIKSGGNGNVSVTGTGGTGDVGTFGTGHVGVALGTTGLISSGGNGTVIVTGNGGGNGARTNNYGLMLTSGASISSGGAGTVTVNGNGGTVATGATQHGVSISGNNSKITSGGGNIIINATEGASSTSYAFDVSASGGGITTATNGGDITLNGNSIKLATTAIATTAAGTLNIIPLTNNTEVQFTTATDVKGALYLSSTELGLITAGNINIGNANTGLISVSQAVTAPTGSNLKLTNANGINPKFDGTEITMASGKTLDITGVPSINIAISGTTVNTQYDQLKVVADIDITGKTLSLSGSYSPVGGEVFTIVDATNITGTFNGLANGDTVTFNGIKLTINYTPTSITLNAPCTNPSSGGTIAAAQSGNNPFTPAAFTSNTAASGQTGALEYKWQSSITSNSSDFIDIASSNTETYAAGALTQTTWFKRLARVACSADWSGAVESNVVEVTVISTVPPTADPQTFCGSKTVADLIANGEDLLWYDAETGGNLLTSSTVLASGTYYVSQTVNGNESTRTSVTVTVNTTTAPTAAAQTFCGSKTVADLVPTGTDLKWYDVASNGTALTNTDVLVTGTYYVSQTQDNCESDRTAVTVTVNATTGSAQTVSQCGVYTWPTNNQPYSQSGTYTAVLTNAAGCDSTVTLNLTIKEATTGSETVSNCGSYTWATNGQTYTQTGTYTATLTNAAGCDSTITLNLTVNEIPSSGTISGANAVCIGGTINLTPSVTGGTWSTSSAPVVTVTNGVVNGVAAGTATISYNVVTGNCSSTSTKLITVELVPVVTINGSSKICKGGRAMMKASVSGGIWGVENNALLVTSSQGLFRNPSTPATDNFKSGINYTLKSKLGACTRKVVKDVYVRNVVGPSITITAPKTGLIVNETVTATATTSIAATGVWSSMSSLVSATRNTINTKTAAIKGLKVSSVNANVVYYADDAATGCRQLNWLTFRVGAASSIVDVAASHRSQTDGVHIYPNPSNGKFTFENIDGATSVKLVDLSGRVIATQPINAGTTAVDFSGVATGKYMVHVTGKSINEIQSVVIE